MYYSTKTNISLILTILICSISYGQDKNLRKAARSLEKGKYTSALKSSEKALKKNSKSQAALMYKSQALYHLYKSPQTSRKYPNGLKESIKSAEKAFGLGKQEFIRENFGTFLNLIIEENNKEAEASFKAERYQKASQHYKINLSFNPNDTLSLFKLGSCYWFEKDYKQALPYLKRVAFLNHSAFLDSTAQGSYEFKAFRYLGEYFSKGQQWDSAELYVTKGLEIFPYDHLLKGYRYGLHRVKVQDAPPSLNFLEEVRKILNDYPGDSFFLSKENALYIFLFKQAVKNNNLKQADSILGFFVDDRLKRSKSPEFKSFKKIDIFIDSTPERIFYKLLDYSTHYYHPDIFQWLVEKWASEVLKKDKVSSTQFLQLCEQTFTHNSKKVAALMLLSEFERVTRKAENDKLISEMTYRFAQNHTPTIGLDYLYQISSKIFNGKTKASVASSHLKLSYTFIDSLAHSNYFFRAYEILNRQLADFPKESDYINKFKKRELATLDFKFNYFGSRTSNFGAEPKPGEVFSVTDMFHENCEPGSLPLEVLEAVTERINYFRRNSGVESPIYLRKDLNEKCQFAAVMFQANKRMFHEAVEGLRCFTPIGKEAAENSLLINSNNPALSITYIMGDNKSTAQGNRRWLQYPLSKEMGFGAGNDFSALWAIDYSNSSDTLLYKNKFIAWPNQGFTPKMFAFKKWSFSISEDVVGAEIKVTDGKNQEVSIKTYMPELGYGMPTIVFEPEIKLNAEPMDETFNVSVKLKSGRYYHYSVTFFTPEI